MTAILSHVLATDQLAVQVVPELGGRITELTDLSSGRQWLWRNHRVPFGPVPVGSAYDDVWQGGFEELFPNDAPTELNGQYLPDHGELWSVPWSVEQATPTSITLSVTGPVTGVRVSKTLSLAGSTLAVGYRLTNQGNSVLDHMFKLHPAIAVHQACRIELPGGTVEKVASEFGNLLDSTAPQPWPTSVDLSQCRRDSSRTSEFVYVSDLTEGRCGVIDTNSSSWVRIEYPTDVFPYCWVFMTYGGWRDHNVVVLEPCTNYPKDLGEAVSRGSSAGLAPGEIKEFEVRVSVGASHE